MSLLDPNARATGQASARLRNKVSAHPRQSSGVYNTFSAKQISGLREAFGTIDTDSDGFITRRDLDAMLGNLGQANEGGKASAALMQSALKDGEGATEKVNFTQFLTMFGEHLSEVSVSSRSSSFNYC